MHNSTPWIRKYKQWNRIINTVIHEKFSEVKGLDLHIKNAHPTLDKIVPEWSSLGHNLVNY